MKRTWLRFIPRLCCHHVVSKWQGFPMAYLTVAAGGLAVDGAQDVLDVQPDSIHQRCPIFLGSRRDVEQVQRVFVAHK